MPNPIPAGARAAIINREKRHCLYCSGYGSEVHHRRRRRIGGHGLDNMILLCKVCHDWAHAHPALARDAGLIVSSFNDSPGDVPVESFHGPVWLTLTGTYERRQPSADES